MQQAFDSLAALVTDTPGDRPGTLAEARALWARIGTLSNSYSGGAMAELASSLTSDFEIWFGPHQWDAGLAEIAAAKADFLADLLDARAALLRRHH